jgi:hypothetical protein
MKKFKRYIVVFFCSLLVFPLLLIIALQLWQMQIQNEARERLENEHLQTITVIPRELLWKKKNKEVSIKGELFDVKTTSFQNGKYILTGLFDKQETALVRILTAGENLNLSIIQLLLLTQCFAAIIYCISISIKSRVLPKLSTLLIEYPVQLSLAVPGHPPQKCRWANFYRPGRFERP